jgi:hypothetical protein
MISGSSTTRTVAAVSLPDTTIVAAHATTDSANLTEMTGRRSDGHGLAERALGHSCETALALPGLRGRRKTSVNQTRMASRRQ